LTLVAIGYAFLGSFISYLLGRQLIWLNFTQLQREADYRYKLVNIRDNSESIALYHGERKERTRSRQLLSRALDNLKKIISKSRNLNLFTNLYNYLIIVIPQVIVAPLYFNGEITLGVVTQATGAFAQTLGALSIIVTNFGGLTAFGAVINRLGMFFESLEEIEWRPERATGVIDYRHEKEISFHGVTILPPKGGRPVVRDLSFHLKAGQKLLICGPSGSGKSSIIRAIAGLWNNGEGLIVRPRLKTTLFLPQRPYMILGSLRNQLLYVRRGMAVTEDVLWKAIKQAHLEKTIERIGSLDEELDWANVLSMGEQQRIAFARLFLVRPEYAFIDEATTAVEPQIQKALYDQLASSVESYISVGHRDALTPFHDFVLELSNDGTWSFERLS
jgi:putative ATP-binding cassette transporter